MSSADLVNTRVRRDAAFRGPFTDTDYQDVAAFFRDRPALTPSPLRSLPDIASALGLAALDVKDESTRFGIDAFKIVGVTYAVHRLGPDAASRGLVCATAGNHGRAVARAAHARGIACTVFVPTPKTAHPLERRTRAARLAAMREDGATVIEINGTYEDAVRRAAQFGEQTGATIVSDTSWEGYDEIPRWIMLGYTQLFEEASRQWEAPPDLVVVQGGVGGLVCAAAAWFAHRFGPDRPYLVACEPRNAACLLASAAAGHLVHLDASLDTIMAGLRCADPSPAAWPTIAAGIDRFITVPDEVVLSTLALLSQAGISAGPSGACGVAALRSWLSRAPDLGAARTQARPAPLRALAVITEGA